MRTEPGEYLVGAYLKLVEQCDVVDYNVRTPGGGLEGLGELDVIGLNFKTKTAYICEVTTHILGLLYKDKFETVARIGRKHSRQRKYADKFLRAFEAHRFMFWSPVVRSKYVISGLGRLQGLELVINGQYKNRLEELKLLARKVAHETQNPAFRVLQIIEHLRDG